MTDYSKGPQETNFNYPKELIPNQEGLIKAFKFKGDGHSGIVETMLFSSNDRYLITGGSEGTIKVWDFKTKKLVKAFGHSGMIQKLFLTSDDQYLISCAYSKIIKIWDFQTGKLLQQITAEREASFVTAALTPDEKYLVSGASSEMNPDFNSLQVWDLLSGKLLRTIHVGEGEPNHIAITNDGKNALVKLGWDSSIYVWEITSGAYVKMFKDIHRGLSEIVVSPHDQRVYTGSMEGSIIQWDFELGIPLKSIKTSHTEIKQILFSSDKNKLICCSGGFVKDSKYEDKLLMNEGNVVIIDLISFTIVSTFEDEIHGDAFASIALTQDGRYLITGDDYNKSLVRIWDNNTGDTIHTIKGSPHKKIASLAFLPDNKTCIVASEKPYLQIFNISDGKLVKNLKASEDFVWEARTTPNGKFLFTISRENNIKMWDVSDFSLLHTFDEIALHKPLSISPSGKYLACTSSSGVSIIDVEKRILLDTRIDDEDISSVGFTPDENIITFSYESTIKVWNRTTGILIRSFQRSTGSTGGAISPNGRYLVANPEWNKMYVWDFSSGELLKIFEEHHGIIDQTCYSPDGNFLASASADGQVRVWSFENETGYGPFFHNARINALTFLPNGEYVVGGDDGADVKVWDFRKGPTFNYSIGSSLSEDLPPSKAIKPEEYQSDEYIRKIDQITKSGDHAQADIVHYWYQRGWTDSVQFCSTKMAAGLKEFLEVNELDEPRYYDDFLKRIEFLPKDLEPKAIPSQERKIELSELTKRTPEQDLFEEIGKIFTTHTEQELPYEDLGKLLGVPDFMRTAMESRDNIVQNLFDLMFQDFSGIIQRSLNTIENPEKTKLVKKIIANKIDELRHLVE
ncbi:MAG: WD40 repeat domain-containing protein [Promethearchaeota archaeon]